MMHTLRVCISFLLLLLSGITTLAQNDADWTLQRAVQYALDHNISIKQNELNRRLQKLTLRQNQLSQIPAVNVSTSYGRSFGRSIDPTSNQFVNGSSYDFAGLSGNGNVLVFGWFQRRNTIAQSRLNLEAANKDYEQIKNDVSLNVATGFLRVLLAQEQVKINKQQVDLSKQQLDQTRDFANVGRVPELNVAQLESQLATDSSNLIAAIAEYNASVLDIKAILNLDFEIPFNTHVPDIDPEKDFGSLHMKPDEIYMTASRTLPTLRSSELKLKAARKGYAAAFGGLFPQLSVNAQVATNYSTLNKNYNVTGVNLAPVQGTYAVDTISNSAYQVYQSTPVYTTTTLPLDKQLHNNFRQTVSLSLNVPIFNGWQAQTAMRKAKINMLTQELNLYQSELKLKQDVYKAHNDARNSLQKYYAAVRAEEAARRAYDYAKKRNDLGLTNTVEYLVTQNNWYKAAANVASAKYDLVFKIKVLDYYLGNEIKL